VCRTHHAEFGGSNGHRGSAKQAAAIVVDGFGHLHFSFESGSRTGFGTAGSAGSIAATVP
jgi:hypothetical protein